jgi:hypothetical protein
VRLCNVALLFAVHAWAVVSIPFHFEPNQGQASGEARYLARVRGASVYLTDTGIVLSSKFSTLTVRVDGADDRSVWQTAVPGQGTTSYYKGNDPAKWLRAVPHVARVERKSVYPGIDLAVYGKEGRLEFDFVIAPGADPNRIRLRFSGTERLRLTAGGDLVISTAGGDLIQKKPVLYQAGVNGSIDRVEGAYRLVGRDAAEFAIGKYDRNRALTIDPVLESATLLGGSGEDRIYAPDSTGVIAGSTTSWDLRSADSALRGGTDIFCYVPAQENTVIMGGSGDDIVTSVAGSVIGGYTNSRDFPTVNWYSSNYGKPLQAQYGGGAWDGFVMIIGTGGNLFLSSYLGGSGDDRVLAVDGRNIYYGLAAAGSTTSSDFPLASAWQSKPGGGVDGFVTLMTPLGIYASSYLGGSGDDRALAVATSSNTQVYVAGESRSANLSLPSVSWNGARKGTSDAFVLRANWNSSSATFLPDQAAWFGGSGEDRATAIAVMPNGNLAVAGVTASTDFKASGVAAGGTRGGGSDLFLTQVSPDLKTPVFVTVAGGSGSDEPLALATNSFNELLAGGWTDSPNFPQTDPLQKRYGGGSSDGFLYHTDSEGKVIYSAYYGGSGADRVLSVGFYDGKSVFFGGVTDSKDLPLKNPIQSVISGGLDGFYGVLTVPAIHADGVVVGKDLAGSAHARLGDSQNYIGVPLTVTSTNPSRVLVALETGDSGSTAITVSDGETGVDPATRGFLVYCMTDSGSVPITLAAPGYPTRSITARCVPSGLSVSSAEVVVTTSGNGSGQGSIQVVTAALDPATGKLLQVQAPRGGLGTIRVDAASSDKTVVELATSSISIDAYTTNLISLPPGITFTTKKIGSADIVLTAGSAFSFVPSGKVHVRVTGPVLTLYVPRLARDFVDYVSVGFSPDLSTGSATITLTSSDPSKLRLARSPREAGAASTTFTCTGSFCTVYASAYDSTGPVSITASAPGFEPVTVLVPLVEASAGFYTPYRDKWTAGSLAPNASTDVVVRINADLPMTTYASAPMLRAGAAAVTVHVGSSDSSVAAATTPDVTIQPGSSLTAAVTIKAIKSGSAVLSPSFPSGRPLASKVVSSTVTVSSTQMEMTPITVGYNLQRDLVVNVPGASSSKPPSVTLTSSDPSRVLFAPDATSAGKPSITFKAYYSYNAVYVQALANSGDVEITATSAGMTSAKTTVHLVPSGFDWRVAGALTLAQAETAAPSISAYALDRAKLAPLAVQSLRPGVSGSLALVSSNTQAVTVAPKTIALTALGGSQSPVTLTAVKPGQASVSITQPTGYATPAGSVPLSVKVTLPQFVLRAGTVGRNMQAQVLAVFSGRQPDASARLTVRSADPSRLVLSTSSTEPGTASVTVSARSAANWDSPGIYMHALNGPVDVKLTASVPGFEDATPVVRIVPSVITFTGDIYSSSTGDPVAETNTQGDPITVSLSVASLEGSALTRGLLRAGLAVIPVQIVSSDPKVAAVQKNPVLLNASTGTAVTTLKPLSAGKTTLTFSPPPAFLAAPTNRGRTLTVTVNQPALGMPDLTLGKDLQTCATVGVVTGASRFPKDADVTITSADISRVLLSLSGTSRGAGAVVFHVVAGQSLSQQICVQALADNGVAGVAVSAPGYRTTTAKVTLTPTTLTNDWSQVNLSLAGSDATVRLRPVPATADYRYYGSSAFQFRPLLTSFRFNVSVSNPSIATVSPSQLTVSGGISQWDVAVKPVAAGSTTLVIDLPAPYVSPASLPIVVQGGTLYLNGATTIGKDLQAGLSVSYSGADRPTVTFKSSDPTRLLVSSSPTARGQASVTVPTQSGVPSVYFQALADSGTVTVTASAQRYQDRKSQVQLTPAAAVLSGNVPSSLSTLSSPVTLKGVLAAYSPDHYIDTSAGLTLRGGATRLSVPVTLSDSKIGSVSTAQLVFQAGDSTQSFTFTPLAAGSVVLSLGVPAGWGDALSERQKLITVSAPRPVLIGASTVGKDLRRASGLRMSDNPAQAVTATLTSLDPARLLLATPFDSAGSASVSITLPGNGYVGSFDLIGLASSGSAKILVTAPGLADTTFSITLQPSGFRVSAPSSTITVGSTASVQLYSCALDAATLAPAGDLPLRPGVATIPVTLASSDTNVVTVPSAPVYFYADESVHVALVTAKKAGSATLRANAPGFTAAASGGSATITVQ